MRPRARYMEEQMDDVMENWIKIDRVKPDHLRGVLRELGSDLAEEKDVSKLVAGALIFFVGNVDDVRFRSMGKCDNCGGVSPDTLDACPFCGRVGKVHDKEGNGAVDGKAQSLVPYKRTRITKADSKPAVATPSITVMETLAPAPELDQIVRRIHILKAEASLNLWKLGSEIAEVHVKNLWKHRKREDGKPAYTSFVEWCHAELGMSRQNAFDLIDLSNYYDEQQVRRFGKESLVLLCKAPEASKAEIMAEMEAGKLRTTRQVKSAVADARQKAGTTGKARDTGRNVGRGHGTAPGKKITRKQPLPEKITVAIARKSQRVQFFAAKSVKGKEPKPVKLKVSGEPVARVELSNRVTVYIHLFNDKSGHLVGRLLAKRDAP
jgi:hypothetical protein